MSDDPYSEKVRALFADTAHCGDLTDGVTSAADGQGVRVTLAAATAGEQLSRLRFRAFGCPHFIAACEHVCRSFEGHRVAELATFGVANIMRDLPVPVEKTGRILVLEDAVRALELRIGGGTSSTTT